MTAIAPATAAHNLPPQPRRRWWQFSLRTLLLAMLVLGVLFGLFAIRLERARRQAAAVATIRGLGGEVYYDFEIRPNIKPGVVPRSSVTGWLLGWLGEDFFHDVGQVSLGPAALPRPAADVKRCWTAVSELPRLEGLMAWRGWIDGNTPEMIEGQVGLRRLFLEDGNLGDSDLAPLANLRNLKELTLDGNPISDKGARYLSGFPKLIILSLRRTQIGDEGAGQIADNRTLQLLLLDDTHVGDGGATEIARLRNLQKLTMSNTTISDVGVAKLTPLKALAWLEINHTHVTGTGFRNFSPDSQLKKIAMRGCPVSDEGVLAIGRFRRLEDLFLDAREPTAVTMASLGQIEWPSSLENIYLHGSGLTDEGLTRFVDCPKLRQIGIKGTQVTPEGARRFRTARPTVNVVGP